MVKSGESILSPEFKIKIPKTDLVRIQDLKENPKNVKEHPQSQIDGLKELIKLEGFVSPLLIDKSNVIWAGHARIVAAKELGMIEVPCVRLENLTKKQLKAIMIMDNRINESAWNKENLAFVLEDIKDFKFEEFQMNFDEFRIKEPNEESEISEPPKIPKSKLGDIYQLGPHRIMCGDCTDEQAVNKLLDGKTVDQLATDPPYGVDYAKKNVYLNRFDRGNRIQKAYANDERERDYVEFFSKFLSVIPFSAYNTIYIFMSGKHYRDLLESTEKSEMFHGTDLIWVKNNHVLGPSDYLPKHELCFYGWKGKHKFYGGKGKRTTVLEYDKPLINDLHPTMKPVEIFCQLIQDGSKKGMLVYEPFLGSGTTLIAAEQTGRICYGMELDPAYVDVEIERWEKLTGKKAKLVTRVKN